jgi:8-oxo-dGTP pyrophosphatase MutT (NUDIX family)
VDLAPYRRKYARFPVERRDWLARDAREYAAFANHPTGAGALVWDKSRQIVLVRHAPDGGWPEGWATPGGLAESGETPESCAVRETKEETGVDIRITGLTRVILYFVANDHRVVPFTFFQFEAEAIGGVPRLGKEIAEVAWFDRLPDNMHFRADYVDAWMRRRPSL